VGLVAGDEEIQVTIVVRISPGGADGMVLAFDADTRRDLIEDAAAIAIEHAPSVRGDEQVEHTIAVEISDRAAHAALFRRTA
jgi:hypothetical protein